MSSRRVAELDDECLVVEHDPQSDPYAVQVRPMYFEWLRDAGHPVEDVTTVYNNVSLKTEGNSGYLVMEIVTLDFPLDIADATADQTKQWVCSCADFHYRKSPDLQDGERPSDSGTCAHIDRVKKKERQAVDDDSQASLGEVGD